MSNFNVHGYFVNYEEASRNCVMHLVNSSYEQVKPMFDKAVAEGSYNFEYEGGGYKLTWTGSGTYSVVKKY